MISNDLISNLITKKNHEQIIHNGTFSKSVIEFQNRICKSLRPVLYNILGLSWPFVYDIKNDSFQLETEKSLAQYSDFEIKHLSFLLGPCIFNTKNQSVPVITHRINKKTSQGRVVMTETRIGNAKIVAIVKCNQITENHRTLWLADSRVVKLKIKSGF